MFIGRVSGWRGKPRHRNLLSSRKAAVGFKFACRAFIRHSERLGPYQRRSASFGLSAAAPFNSMGLSIPQT